MADITYGAGALNIAWPQGTRLGLQIDGPDDWPGDFTEAGTIIRSTWRLEDRAGDAALNLSTSALYLTITGPASFRYEVPAPIMAGLGTPGVDTTLYHDVEVVPGGVAANAYRLCGGKIVLSGEATQ